jgi:hypothetical protein
LKQALAARGTVAVDYAAVQRLEAAEKARASVEKVEEFKFASDGEMLDLLRG